MDFFEAQARARKRTGRLVVLFVLAVIGTIVASYVAIALIIGNNHRGFLWDPSLFAMVSAGTLCLVGGASLLKWSELSAGGSAVAEMVGGRRIRPGNTSVAEQRLLNVVEEMAIASSVPVPAVYVLDDEDGINAFAAGLTTGDAVVAVTRGTLNKLNRDELQGVIGHEFSHILNGDMRMNVRLTALLFGILVIGLLGRGILYGLRGVRVRGGGDKKNSGAAIVLIGLALMVIGYLGYFFGRLIQAAVSRQREFLADASAVQFTRNPLGISGALKRIAADANGSELGNTKASEIGHFFFAQGFSSWFGGLMATHPPLDERIRAVEPSWDGKFPGTSADAAEVPPVVRDTEDFASQVSGLAGAAVSERRNRAFDASAATARAGTITEQHFQNARSLLAKVPDSLRTAAGDTPQAMALALGLLLPAEADKVAPALNLVASKLGQSTADSLRRHQPELAALSPETRLPLLQLLLPSLRELQANQGEALISAAEALALSDGVISPFEIALQKVLVRSLRYSRKPVSKVDFYDFQVLWTEIAVVLSTLAHLGDRDGTSAGKALTAGLAQLQLAEGHVGLLPREKCSVALFSSALDKLGGASLPIKKRLLAAAAHVIGADGFVTNEEAELYRAIAAALDCPMPVWEQATAARV